MPIHTILWRRLDAAGHESARIVDDEEGARIAGTAVFADDGRPCRFSYEIACDASWRTVSAALDGWVGGDAVSIRISVDPGGGWTIDGLPCPAVAGCTDLDLSFSPVTNLLPIRRLDLAVGAEAPITAAWLRVPGFTLEPLPQRYRRTAQDRYRYESAGGAFVRELRVNAAGLVTLYPGLWQAEAVE
ncbi:MAG TPA: putative glycolipid-binding domain-containing protein [Longimicrobiaceae bacterium]|jgi:hypothetical protein|nr:putative glycolipid-binding domain-containing protein [Longimicrobiaceae bacterium]